MAILPINLLNMALPEMVRARQRFDSRHIDDYPRAIQKEFEKRNVASLIRKNESALLLVGSRGIYQLDTIVREMGNNIKALGAVPYVMPAMGSHGGGTIEGQIKVLSEYHITEDNVDMEIVCSNETCVIGETSCGTQIKICAEAMNYDHIIPIARVKPHTDFKGSIESGICKMLVIGLGKHEGCYTIHKQGFGEFPRLIPEAAEIILNQCPVTFGLAIIENAYDQTYHLELVKNEDVLLREPELLKIAKDKIGKILIEDIDVMVVEYTGKDVSGAGMDSNVIGRTTQGTLPGYDGPVYRNLVVLDLTEQTQGNASGIGVADFITRKLFDKIDIEVTYTNAIASSNLNCAKIPIICSDEREAILAACLSCGSKPIEDVKIVRIKDTLHVEEIQVSKNMINDINRLHNVTLVNET